MSIRMEAELRTLVLALYDEAALTAASKGLNGTLGQLAALHEAASLAAGTARRAVSQEEVLRVVLSARRSRRPILLPDGALPAPLFGIDIPTPGPSSEDGFPATTGPAGRLRRGRLAARAARSLNRPANDALI